jgi:hypothetical protein
VSDVAVVFLEVAEGIYLEYHQVQKPLSVSMDLLIYVCHKVLLLQTGCRLQVRAELGLCLHPLLMVFVTHRSWDVNWFPKQSAIALAFLFGLIVIPKELWTAVGAFGSSLFISDFTIGHRAWDKTSQFPTFISHRSSAFLHVIHLVLLIYKNSVRTSQEIHYIISIKINRIMLSVTQSLSTVRTARNKCIMWAGCRDLVL